jgi:hypothetical protein
VDMCFLANAYNRTMENLRCRTSLDVFIDNESSGVHIVVIVRTSR